MDKYDKLGETIIMDDLKRLFEQHSTPSKELDALKRIETCAELGIDTHSKNVSDDMAKLRSDISIIQQAIYRNIPERVKIVATRHSYDRSITHTAELCPICNHDVSHDSNFCGTCGQALKSK